MLASADYVLTLNEALLRFLLQILLELVIFLYDSVLELLLSQLTFVLRLAIEQGGVVQALVPSGASQLR